MSTRYAAKNATSNTFAISLGSNVSGPIPTHSRAPLIVRPMPGRERQEQEDDAEQQQRVAVTLEDADVANDEQREDEHADPDRDPHRLHARLLGVVGSAALRGGRS